MVILPRDNFVFNDRQMVRTDNLGQQYSYTFNNVTLMKALDLGTFVLTAYRNTEGTHFLGRFSPQLKFLNEYHFGHAKIRDIRGTAALFLVRYLDAGYEYIGTFDGNLNYLGSYWFYQNARIEDFGIRENRPFVTYDLESDSGTRRYTAFFDRNMNFLHASDE